MDFNGIFVLATHMFRYFSLWDANVLGSFTFTVPNSFPFYVYLKTMYTVFGIQSGTYMVFAGIIFLVAWTGYILAHDVLASRRDALILTPLFVLNPYFVYNLFNTGTVTFLLAWVGFHILFITYYRYRERFDDRYLAIMILGSIPATHPFTLFFYTVIAMYLLTISGRPGRAVMIGAGITILNAFWIVPFLTSYMYPGARLLGSYTSNLVTTYASLGKFQYSFLFLGRSHDALQSIWAGMGIFVAGIILSFWCLAIGRSFFRHAREFVPYWILIIILLVFSIGPRGSLGQVYAYMFEHFSWFSFFRSYQNVYIALSAFFLFMLLLIAKKDTIMLRTLQAISVLMIGVFLFARDTDFTAKSVVIPPEYFEAKKIIDADTTASRVLLLPRTVYDYYTWDPTRDRYFLESFFGTKGLIFYRPTLDNPTVKSLYELVEANEATDRTYRQLGVKYILRRLDLVDRDPSIDFPLAGKRILTTKNIELSMISDPDAYVQAHGAEFQRVNATTYRVYIHNLHDTDLRLLETFHSGWRLELMPHPNDLWCSQQEYHASTDTMECTPENGVMDGGEIARL